MPSLRTAFIETFIPRENIFCALIAYFPIIFHPAGTTEEIGKEKKGPLFRDRVSTIGKQVQIPCLSQPNHSLKALQGLMNMNIINFSQLLDNNLNDYKDCEKLVHAIELGQEEEIFCLSQIETMKSFTASSLSERTTIQNNSQKDFSQVEDIES